MRSIQRLPSLRRAVPSGALRRSVFALSGGKRVWHHEPNSVGITGAGGAGSAVGVGAGAAVSEALAAAGITLPVLHLGLPDRFIEHGDPAKLLALQGLDAAGIERAIRQRFLHTQA